jgi:ribosomal protein S18 acetylase RimI-like enzyme
MVEAICRYHQQLDPARYDYLPDVVERYRRWLPQRASDPRSVFLVARPAAESPPVGFLVASTEPNIPIYRTATFGYIHDVWVEPAFRRRGVATRMVAECLRRFRAIGATQVRLETAAKNEAARRLFAAAGFRRDAITMICTPITDAGASDSGDCRTPPR